MVKKEIIGFGFVPAESQNHVLVTIPASRSESVVISEHLTWDPAAEAKKITLAPGQEESKVKVILPRLKWDKIADFVEAEFNDRLRRQNLRSGKWKTGEVPVARLLGKELILLAWAIEDADPTLIPAALNNWQGLLPEERWWLFTMTNAATGHAINGRNKGWRKAIRFALTENPTTGQPAHPGLELFELIREQTNQFTQLKDPHSKNKSANKTARKKNA
ncbi:MAG: DUF3780 domain-containing protein [Acidobacteria bacterium]|nr:DUF3780 domain-containing protein [Acidobacteriota bacterium]